MSFFDELDQQSLPPPERPPWHGPSAGELAALHPDRRVAARGPDVQVVLTHVDVHTTGCTLRLRAVVRRPDGVDEEAWRERSERAHHPTARPEGRGAFRFGVAMSDGSRAILSTPSVGGADPPRPPVLHQLGRRSSSGRDEVTISVALWLWPLPPSEPFDLVLAWGDMGVEETRIELDGAAITDAAARAEPLFE